MVLEMDAAANYREREKEKDRATLARLVRGSGVRRNQAQFACVACGYENHADVVGAINVLERGHRLLACGESAQLGRSVKQEPAEVRQAQV